MILNTLDSVTTFKLPVDAVNRLDGLLSTDIKSVCDCWMLEDNDLTDDVDS